MTALLVGIAGGSGSGKTTLADGVALAWPAGTAALVPADAYYHDLGHLPPAERARRNFDEPAALDWARLQADLLRLRSDTGTARPTYDFTSHTRTRETVWVPPAPVVMVEGILVLAIPSLRELLDLGVFVAAGEPTRLARRLARDVGERGRSRESVLAQFRRDTQPMHERYVAPSQAHAHLVISGEGDPGQAVQAVAAAIARLQRNDRPRHPSVA
jgi:uridine kinase